jgi:integrase
VVPLNPAASVRGPCYTTKEGKTPVLSADEARVLLDSIKVSKVMDHNDGSEKEEPRIVGLRDRALIALMTYTFARVGAAIGMDVEDYYVQGRRWWVRLHEKGGRRHEMPTHHNLAEYLAAGIGKEKGTPLFRTARGKTQQLTERRMSHPEVYLMIRRCAAAAGIKTLIGYHTFRATGITAYLKSGGKLEVAQQMAAHESARTTGLDDRRGDEISLDEVERIVI